MPLLQQHKAQQAWIFENRAILPMKEQYVWEILSGVVRGITWLEDGTMIILGLWGQGETVGKLVARTDPYQLECIGQVKASSVLLSNPQQVADILSLNLKQIQELTAIRSYRRVDTMILKLLEWLGDKFGQETSTGQLIDIRLTHQDIAEILGTTRVTITRNLGLLEKEGIIQRLPLHRLLLKEYDTWHYEI